MKFLLCKLILIPLLLMSTAVLGQEADRQTDVAYYSLKDRHSLDLSFGLLSDLNSSADVTVGGVHTRSSGNGFLGSVIYSYWPEDELAVSIHVGVQNTDIKTSVTGLNVVSESAVIIPVLFGVKYQVFRITEHNNFRPYASVSIGPYFGFVSNVRTGFGVTTESIAEVVLGSRLAADFDLLLSRRFKLGIGAGYRFVSDFSRRIGTERNYSSPEFSICLGFILGRAKN
ncbi:MAG TPA: hypothetical protein VKA08_00050 [Balneolales bacterium]|nr:hypothetical protein [Balneolales bacterium]